MVDNKHRRIIRRPLWHCWVEPCEQKLRGCSSDLTDWSEAGLMVWWMYRPMDLILGSATCGVTATLCWPATHLHNIGCYQQNTQSPCSSKYWFRYLMCVVLRLYWRWQFYWHDDMMTRSFADDWPNGKFLFRALKEKPSVSCWMFWMQLNVHAEWREESAGWCNAEWWQVPVSAPSRAYRHPSPRHHCDNIPAT